MRWLLLSSNTRLETIRAYLADYDYAGWLLGDFYIKNWFRLFFKYLNIVREKSLHVNQMLT